MKIDFQKATSSQHNEIHRLMQVAFMPYVQKLDSRSASGPYPWLKASLQKGDVYIALEDKEILGFVSTKYDNGAFIIGQLGVKPKLQGNGIGSLLLKNIELIARQKRASIMKLNTAEMMDHLLRLYRRHGYTETSRALPAHGEDEHMRVHMEKRL